jgi:hypothetical protein
MRCTLVLLAAVFAMLLALGCSSKGDDDTAGPTDDDASPAGDDDDASPVDDDDDASPTDDDASPADDDSSPLPDDFVAPWPQSNVEPRDYNENVAAGFLRQKADAYDQWHIAHNQPYYGDSIGVQFTDTTYTTVAAYYDWGDSCEFTGIHLGSQACRYYVTNDPQAKAEAILVADALDGNLKVTQTPGFIARYRGKQELPLYQGDAWCESDPTCHHVDSGPFAGDVWWGNTSRDMYSGWFFGMSLAYDLIDDAATHAMIRADVAEVVRALIEHNWVILDQNGQPTDAGPDVLPPFQLSWLTVAYHMTGDARVKQELQKRLVDSYRPILAFECIGFFNRYAGYFGNCLSHETWYNLLRLAKVYFSPHEYQYLLNVYNTQIDTYTRLTHNAWFTAVLMGQGGYAPAPPPDPYQTQLLDDLTDFPPAPHFRVLLPAKNPATYTVDPISELLYGLQQALPWLGPMMGSVVPQALDAFPVTGYCSDEFIFQTSPFVIQQCGEGSPTKVDAGVDFLIPYWLASYHKFITKEM